MGNGHVDRAQRARARRDPDVPDRGHPRLHALHRPARRRGRLAAGRAASRRSPPRASRRGAASSSSCAATRRWRSSTRRARRCARAVELQSAFADETRTIPSCRSASGIGLDAGEAVPVGDGYRGAALNLAARLCAVARPARSSPARASSTSRARSTGCDYRAVEPAAVQGLRRADRRGQGVGTATTAAAAAASPPGRPSRRPGAAPPLPPELDPIVPIAGREAELRWLRWHWRRASHGHGRTVVLSGPPGIGKTRLAAELATVAHDGGAAVVYAARGPARRRPSAPVDRRRPPAARPRPSSTTSTPPPPMPLVRLVERARTSPADRAHVPGHPPPRGPAAARRRRRAAGPRRAAPDARPARRGRGAGHRRAVRRARPRTRRPSTTCSRESGGVPAAIHRVASQWARTAAAGRLGASADRTAAGRRGLRDAEAALIGDVADLELARERDRLYAVDRRRGRRCRQPTRGPSARTRAWPSSRPPTPTTTSAASGSSPSSSRASWAARSWASSATPAAASRRRCGPACCRPSPAASCRAATTGRRRSCDRASTRSPSSAARSPAPCRARPCRPTTPSAALDAALAGARRRVSAWCSWSTSSRRSSTPPATTPSGAPSSTCSPASAPA